MSRGYPDFYGAGIHPLYGRVAQMPYVAIAVARASTESMFTLAGRGRVQGGVLRQHPTAFCDTGRWVFVVDGIEIFEEHAYYSIDRSGFPSLGRTAYLTEYNREERWLTWVIAPDTSWYQSFEIRCINNELAIDIDAYAELIYYVY